MSYIFRDSTRFNWLGKFTTVQPTISGDKSTTASFHKFRLSFRPSTTANKQLHHLTDGQFIGQRHWCSYQLQDHSIPSGDSFNDCHRENGHNDEHNQWGVAVHWRSFPILSQVYFLFYLGLFNTRSSWLKSLAIREPGSQ